MVSFFIAMEYERIIKEINKNIEKSPTDYRPYQELYAVLTNYAVEDLRKAHDVAMSTDEKLIKAIQVCIGEDREAIPVLDDLRYKMHLLGAKDYFDDFLLCIEWSRDKNKKFYAPRRHYLKRYVDAYQMILDGELDFLSISMPKRSGKSTLGILFSCMTAGRLPNKSILMEGTGDDLVKSFYNGVLEYLQVPNDYNFYEIFPDRKIVQTNFETKIINLDKRSRFPTIMCRSIDARQVGLSEATSLLYLDDCVQGREEAKNRMRLDEKWEILSGDVLGRAIEGTPMVICGTRYSIYDPIGRMQETMRKQNKRMMILETPALDPITDESNFEFSLDGQRIFTTQYFKDQREMLSAEQFESEFQQQPFEAKGILFPKDQLNYYFELPVDVEPDAVFAFADTASGGGDYTAMPVLAIYGDEAYMIDAMFDDAPATITKPECAKMIMDNNVSMAVFESNAAGTYFARDIDTLLNKSGYKCSIKSKRTITNKQTRIEFAADNIIKHFWFKDPSTYDRNSQYAQFMHNVTSFTRVSKHRHDDAPDALAMAENELKRRLKGTIEVFQRPF